MRRDIVLAGLSFAAIAMTGLVFVVPSNSTFERGFRVRHIAPLAQTEPSPPQGLHRIRIKSGDVVAQTATANLGRIRTVAPNPTLAVSLR